MTITLPRLADELATTDRTLRRALEQGLLRAERPSARKVELPASERVYLRRAWPLLAELREGLRTEPGLSLAVLFGSWARGDQHDASDIDLLVVLRGSAEPELRARREHALARRLADKVGYPVQVVNLTDADASPLLLAEVLRDGRVLVDRDSLWPDLLLRRRRIERAAARARREVEKKFDAAFAA